MTSTEMTPRSNTCCSTSDIDLSCAFFELPVQICCDVGTWSEDATRWQEMSYLVDGPAQSQRRRGSPMIYNSCTIPLIASPTWGMRNLIIASLKRKAWQGDPCMMKTGRSSMKLHLMHSNAIMSLRHEESHHCIIKAQGMAGRPMHDGRHLFPPIGGSGK